MNVDSLEQVTVTERLNGSFSMTSGLYSLWLTMTGQRMLTCENVCKVFDNSSLFCGWKKCVKGDWRLACDSPRSVRGGLAKPHSAYGPGHSYHSAQVSIQEAHLLSLHNSSLSVAFKGASFVKDK